jgi:glycosyltransferase involved in cell wall biosynthesis
LTLSKRVITMLPGRFKETTMNPKVSICIPTFNRKDYLKETLDSVFAQTYKDYEVVVVDDGSTDGTEKMIKSGNYKNLRYYWQINAGDAAAKNRLTELAQGKYITFIDSDDLLMPDAVERMIKAMDENAGEDVVVYGPYFRIDQDGNEHGKCKRKLYSGNVTRYLFQNIFVHNCGSMCSKKVFRENGGLDESLKACYDYDFWLQLSLKYRFIALPEPTFKRRRHSSNQSAVSSKNLMTELKVLERFYYEKGGKTVIPEKEAMRRLSQEEYRVGKNAAMENNYDLAITYFHKSFLRYFNFKSLLRWVSAALNRLGTR